MIQLREVYEEVVELGILETQAEFSQMCGKQSSWYSSTIARDRQITMDVLYRIKSVLYDIYLETLAAINVDDEPDKTEDYKAGAEALKVLCNRIQTEMDRRSGHAG